MLEPSERQMLADVLRPPPGYQFDRAVSTTYTLDLLTLLTLPVAFTLYQWAGSTERPKMDPLALLEAVRRHARRIHVFCQAGRTAVPKDCQLLFGYLENSVIEATAPKGGAFHPKVTVVRYVPKATDGNAKEPDGTVFYRFLCASRNLTFDRSWDTMLSLEGELATERTRAFSRNRPLSDFIKRLPDLAIRSVRKETREDLALIADELLRVRFTEPEGFEDLAFWPIGLDEREPWPFDTRTDNILVISPFVDADFLMRLSEPIKGATTLVSRPESLDALPEKGTEKLAGCFVLNDTTDSLETQRGDEPSLEMEATKDEETVELQPADVPLRGLHAKVFVADAGWNATLWTGSANATTAAFSRNVEFLVELTGRRKKHGTEALMGDVDGDGPHDRQVTFRDLLVRYEKRGQTEPDAIEVELERALDAARDAIVEAQLTGTITGNSTSGQVLFDLSLQAIQGALLVIPKSVSVRVRPITLLPDAAIGLDASGASAVSFSALSMEGLTRFFAFELTARKEAEKKETGFVLNLPVEGLPTEREANLLLALLSNRQRLLRYLLMLLSDSEIDPMQFLGPDRHAKSLNGDDPHDSFFGLPLLEPLMRTLSHEPHRLERIANLLQDLESTEAGRALVPEGFRGIWEPIWAAREEAPHDPR